MDDTREARAREWLDSSRGPYDFGGRGSNWMHFKDTLLPEGEELNRNDQTGGQASTESPANEAVTAKSGAGRSPEGK